MNQPKKRTICERALERFHAAELLMFDFDGTLVHFHHDFLLEQAAIVNEKLRHPTVSREVLEEGFRRFDFFHFVEASLFGRDEFIKRFWEHFAWDGFPEARILPGVRETLEELQSLGYQMAIVTSRYEPAELVARELERCGIRDFFRHIETRTSLEVVWSDKKPQIHATCNRLGVEPSQAVMVGDIPPDIETAREAGVGTLISVLSGGIHAEVLEKSAPDILLDGVHELRELCSVGKRRQ